MTNTILSVFAIVILALVAFWSIAEAIKTIYIERNIQVSFMYFLIAAAALFAAIKLFLFTF